MRRREGHAPDGYLRAVSSTLVPSAPAMGLLREGTHSTNALARHSIAHSGADEAGESSYRRRVRRRPAPPTGACTPQQVIDEGPQRDLGPARPANACPKSDVVRDGVDEEPRHQRDDPRDDQEPEPGEGRHTTATRNVTRSARGGCSSDCAARPPQPTPSPPARGSATTRPSGEPVHEGR